MVERNVKQFSSDKILSDEHVGRVGRWAEGENVPPITSEIDVTNLCNHHCPDCPGGRDNPVYLEKPREIIDQLAEFGVKGLIFTGGGEPLIDKRTPALVAHAKETGMDVGFITNGSLVNEENSEVIVDNCTWCRVSMDASAPEEYRFSHGMSGKHLERVQRNIRTLARVKKERGSDCTIGVGYLTHHNLTGGMLEATRFCSEAGVDYIQFRPWHRDRTLIDEQLAECLKLTRPGFDVLYSKHKYDAMKTDDWGRNYKVCYGHQFATVVQADGKMSLCCHMRGKEKYVLGDLTENTVEEVWNGELRQRAVESIDFRDCPPLCRCNTFNEILWNIKQPRKHVNFL